MFHYHTFKSLDFGAVLYSSDIEADVLHTHEVTLADGRVVTTSFAEGGANHTHTIVADGKETESSLPVQRGEVSEKRMNVQDKVKQFNESVEKSHKIKSSLVKKVFNRGVAHAKDLDFTGVNLDVYGEDRVDAFLEVLKTGTCLDSYADFDLVPDNAKAKTGDVDIWANISVEKTKIDALRKNAVATLSRAATRKMNTSELVTANKSLDTIYTADFSTNFLDDVDGLNRTTLLISGALVQEELDRRGLLKADDNNLFYVEATKYRDAAVVTKCDVVQTKDGIVLDLGLTKRVCLLANNKEDIDVDKAASNFSLHGSKFHKCLMNNNVDYTMVNKFIGVKVASCLVEKGTTTADGTEFFISGDLTLTITLSKDEASVAETNPKILQIDTPAVDGVSGLPQSIEKQIPAEYKWWKQALHEDATLIKNAFLASNSYDEVKAVDGYSQLVSKSYKLVSEAETIIDYFCYEDLNEINLLTKSVGLDVSASELLQKTEMLLEDTYPEDAQGNVFLASEDNLDSVLAKVDSIDNYTLVVPGVCKRNTLLMYGCIVKASTSNNYVLVCSKEPRQLSKCASFVHREKTDEVVLAENSLPVENISEPSAESKLIKSILKRDSKLIKSDDEERFVYGVVLEPETIDSQKDIYSADTVRDAAHLFMAEYRNAGLMHQAIVNEHVDILESFVAPVLMKVGGVDIKKGTWLMAMRVKEDKLWQAVKSGNLTGFSIGGHARRREES